MTPTTPHRDDDQASLTIAHKAGYAVTVDLSPPRAAAPGASEISDHRVAIVEGSGPALSRVTDTLRQGRLRASALFLCIAFGVSLLWRLFMGFNALWPLHVAVVIALGAIRVLLSDPRLAQPLALRIAEFAIFGLSAGFLAIRQYQSMLSGASRGDATSLTEAAEETLIGSILLIFTHGMLIPNTWRGTARVVIAIAAVPIAIDLVLIFRHPEVLQYAREVATAEEFSENLLILMVACGLTIYGSHIINTLRREAFEARQFNQYRLGERLGSGGMGEVYLAEHRLLRRPCALKLIRPEKAADPLSLARFEREVHATARLSHPNIVEIYDYGHTDDGTFFYVMEYLPGLSLADLVGRYGPLPIGRVVYLLRQVCDGLAEAHAAGLIHRDLKPANILTFRRGRRADVVKLLDFGLVKETAAVEPEPHDLSVEGTVRGTPQYMAPEQVVSDAPLDLRCDLYALGAVAYFLLTGQPPFQRPTAMGVMLAQARDPVTPPSRLRPGLPESLERVVLRCLSKRPTDRYPDAESLDLALANCTVADSWNNQAALDWWRTFEPDSQSATACFSG